MQFFFREVRCIVDFWQSAKGKHGVFVGGGEARLHLQKFSVSEAGQACVRIVEGAHACIENASLYKSIEESGVEASGNGTHVKLNGGIFKEKREVWCLCCG